MKNFKNPEAYIKSFPAEVQSKLKQIRKIIVSSSKGAEESVAYGMVGYKLYGKPLVYFGGFKKHVGFFATPSGHKAFAKEMEKYVHNKGSVQFPLTEKLPLALIKKMVTYRVKENTLKYKKPTK